MLLNYEQDMRMKIQLIRLVLWKLQALLWEERKAQKNFDMGNEKIINSQFLGLFSSLHFFFFLKLERNAMLIFFFLRKTNATHYQITNYKLQW